MKAAIFLLMSLWVRVWSYRHTPGDQIKIPIFDSSYETMKGLKKEQGEVKSKLNEVTKVVETLMNRIDVLQEDGSLKTEQDDNSKETNFDHLVKKVDSLTHTVEEFGIDIETLKGFKRCGPISAVINGTVTYEDNHIGAEATYICHTDFRPCGNMNITCQTTGRWETPGICQKFRWTETKIILGEVSFPCDPQAKLKILVSGMRTTTSEMVIEIRRREDILLQMATKNMMAGIMQSIEFNARINNEWKTETKTIHYSGSAFKMLELEITLEGGMYKVMMNGELLKTVPEQETGGKPDGLKFSGIFVVNKIEILY